MRNILVIEDSSFVHQIYRVAFGKLGGCQVIHANNGVEGLNALSQHEHFDLAVVDINMPVLNGASFITHLRRSKHSRTPVLVATTESKDGKIRDLVAQESTHYLRKPFTLEELLAVLKRLLGQPAGPSPIQMKR